jgi:hypothetical protein
MEQISIEEERGHIENEQLKEQWNSCCSKTNKHFLKYMVQITMGASVMIFSMTQIFLGAENPEIYFSLLSGTLGGFMPNPQIIMDDK